MVCCEGIMNNNCIICAQEFDSDDVVSGDLLKINATNFKICQKCLDHSDPTNDYLQAKSLISSYLKFSEAKHCFSEASDLINSRDK